MNLLNGNGSRLRRFVAGRLGVASTSTSVTCLIIACLAVLMIFLSFACNGPTPTMPTPHQRTPNPPPSYTPSPTVTPTLTPTLFSAVTLTELESGPEFDWGSEITLRWSYPYRLQDGEYYRLRVQPKGQRSFLFYHDEDHFTLPDLSPGDYEWAVAVVRSIGQDQYDQVSEESEPYSFKIAPPKPVVRSVSPASAVRGHSVPVVVRGENFTRSLTIVIGVPLRTTFVDSTTITATVPMTLVAAKYPVVLQDATGATISSAPSPVSFTVQTPTPSVTRTPVPLRCSPPVLGWGGIIACNVTFKWEWAGTLAEDEWFAVRVGKLPDIPHSRTWTKEREYIYQLCDGGDYAWEVAICRGEPATAVCEQLAVSKRSDAFSFGGCSCSSPTITIPPIPPPIPL